MTLHYDRDRDEIMVSDGGGPELRDDILALIKREIAAEREACAQIADDHLRTFEPYGPGNDRAQKIAAAIRARGEGQT